MRSPVTEQSFADRFRETRLRPFTAFHFGRNVRLEVRQPFKHLENGVGKSCRAPNRKRKRQRSGILTISWILALTPRKSCAKFKLGLEEKLRMTKPALK